jgi:hypothetical protein
MAVLLGKRANRFFIHRLTQFGNRQRPRRSPRCTRHAPQEASSSITRYHCKAYSGGAFWANSHCNQHRALVDRMVEVPARLAFSQRVEMAEGDRRAAAALLPASPQSVALPTVSQRGKCDALAHQIKHWDAMARQPQSAQMQDWIRAERHKTRERQWALRCWHWQKIPSRNIMVGSPWATGRVITHRKDGRLRSTPGRGVAGLAPPWRVIRSLTAW